MDPKPVGSSHRIKARQSLLILAAIAGSLQAEDTIGVPTVQLELARPDDVRPRNQSIAVSGDFILGNGNITLPVGYALNNVSPPGRDIVEAARDSVYYGGTINWQITPTWGVDLSYSKGTSTGDFPFYPDARWSDVSVNSDFTLDDTWYQGFVRYRFAPLGKFGLYLRGGVTYVDAEYEGNSKPEGELPLYSNSGTVKDLTGNLGFGLDRLLFRVGESFRTRAVLEGEGFAGIRSRDFTESFASTLDPISNSMDNLIFGGAGRLMLRADYIFGKESQWRVYMDAGMFTRWTLEDYSAPSILVDGYALKPVPSSFQTDLLWGPFVRLGLRLTF